MALLDDAIAYARAHREDHLAAYKEALAIPSVSTLPEHTQDVRRAAEWFCARLKTLGMARVEQFPGKRHPIIYAEKLGVAGAPTVLVYGHYDVQPVDPIAQWNSPPFEPTIKGDYMIARGASDMKGQIVAQLNAVACIVNHGALPLNIKYLLEGEEEIGSPSLPEFIAAHKDLLRADFVLNCDSGIQAPEVPGIIYALRGLAYFELEIRGPKRDLHSGMFGGSVANPINVLCAVIAGMHDAEGRVTLPGFYDAVRALDADERDAIAKFPHSDAEWLAYTGSPALHGEKGYSTLERIGARPTLDVNGIWGGFTGEGSKTVLPSIATAKISTRLVPDQDCAKVADQLRAYLAKAVPATVAWELRELSHGPGAVMNRKSPAMAAAAAALRAVWGRDPVFKREGGSVPVVALMQQQLGIDSIMLGFALPDDGIHGPNERQYLPNFYRGIEAYIRFLLSVGKAN